MAHLFLGLLLGDPETGGAMEDIVLPVGIGALLMEDIDLEGL